MVIKRKSRRDIGEEIKIYPLETIIIFKRQNKYSEFVQNKLKTFRAFIRKKKISGSDDLINAMMFAYNLHETPDDERVGNASDATSLDVWDTQRSLNDCQIIRPRSPRISI